MPEGKSVKKRVHFDLMPTDRTREEEVRRLTGLGAAIHADLRAETAPTGW